MVTLRTAPSRDTSRNVGLGRFTSRRGEAQVRQTAAPLKTKKPLLSAHPGAAKLTDVRPRLSNSFGLSLLQRIALKAPFNYGSLKSPFQFWVQRNTDYGTWIVEAQVGRRTIALSFSEIMGKTFTLHNQSGLMANIRFYDQDGKLVNVQNHNGLYNFKAGLSIHFKHNGTNYIWNNLQGEMIEELA